jgi:4a-hydroxytetrahydrobiopterin dehydratase
MADLKNLKCVPCESEILPLTKDEIEEMLDEIPEWKLVEVESVSHLKRTFKFKDFAKALEFTNQVGAVAEHEGHHPVIELTWGRVTLEWWTHNIQGLHANDFIMAAKSSELYESIQSFS